MAPRSSSPNLFRKYHDIQIASKLNPIPTTLHCHAACDAVQNKYKSLSRNKHQQVCTILRTFDSDKHRMLDIDNTCFNVDGG